jgi:hypothetical protein
MTDLIAQKLAREFCKVFTEWCTPEQLAEVNRRNDAETDDMICHSHDFYDANQAMLDAMEQLSIPYDPSDQSNTDLIMAAWDMAKAAHFTAGNVT